MREIQGYNKAGDRISEQLNNEPVVTYTYDAAGRMITKADKVYSYDTDGNLVRSIEGGKELLYSWNSDNRLTKAEKVITCHHFTKRATEEYTYLPEDWRRLSRTAYTSFNCHWGRKNRRVTTLKRKFLSVYDGQDESHEYWQTPSFMRRAWHWGRFCWRPRVPRLVLKREFIGGPFSDDIEISKYHHNNLYLLKDALGSTIALTNRGGKAIAKIGYDAWGNFRYKNNRNICRPFNNSCLPTFLNRLAHTRSFGRSSHNPWAMGKYFATHLTPYLYAGRRYNNLTHQYFNRNRYYQPKCGRFTNKDPIGFNGDINLYRYANNNPNTYIDATGKDAGVIIATLGVSFVISLIAVTRATTMHTNDSSIFNAIRRKYKEFKNQLSVLELESECVLRSAFHSGQPTEADLSKYQQKLDSAVSTWDERISAAISRFENNVSAAESNWGWSHAQGNKKKGDVGKKVSKSGETTNPMGFDPNENPNDKDQKEWKKLNRSEARKEAKQLGFKETKNPPFNSKGQPAFRSGERWISADQNGYNGGVWKLFDKLGNRLGTYNKELTIRLGK